MEHVRALLWKVLMIGVITVLVLSMFRGITPLDSIYIAIVITAVAYVVSDLLIEPAYGNTAASISDGIIAFLITWLTPFVATNIAVTIGNALAVGILVSLGTWLLDKYVNPAMPDYENKE